MATEQSFIEYLTAQLNRISEKIACKKMFGEYMIYCDLKPCFLVCDNTVFVKINETTSALLPDSDKAPPYTGAKDHYIVDNLDDADFLCNLIAEIAKITPLPKKKAKK